MTAKATPAKATQGTNPSTPDDSEDANRFVVDDTSLTADLMTVLRHLVENQQWGGNHGARAECDEAFTRLQNSVSR